MLDHLLTQPRGTTDAISLSGAAYNESLFLHLFLHIFISLAAELLGFLSLIHHIRPHKILNWLKQYYNSRKSLFSVVRTSSEKSRFSFNLAGPFRPTFLCYQFGLEDFDWPRRWHGAKYNRPGIEMLTCYRHWFGRLGKLNGLWKFG